MFENFTERARKVLGLARHEAQQLNHEYIGTEHILLGLILEGSGVAATVLRNMDVDLIRIRFEIERIVECGPAITTKPEMLPFTPRAKRVIDLTKEEAAALNHEHVGTEHLLLGLLRENEGIAAQVLMNLGVRLDEVREAVIEILSPDMSSVDSDSAPARPPARPRPTMSKQTFDLIRSAEEVALGVGADKVQPEHLLLAMLKDQRSAAAQVLAKLGVTDDVILREFAAKDGARQLPAAQRRGCFGGLLGWLFQG